MSPIPTQSSGNGPDTWLQEQQQRRQGFFWKHCPQPRPHKGLSQIVTDVLPLLVTLFKLPKRFLFFWMNAYVSFTK